MRCLSAHIYIIRLVTIDQIKNSLVDLNKKMLVKEFSQKYSVTLFYTTIVLIILVISLGFSSFSHRGFSRMNSGDFQRNSQQRMIQKDDTNVSDQNVKNQVPDQTQTQPQDQTQQTQ